jgi:hypothetical protein
VIAIVLALPPQTGLWTKYLVNSNKIANKSEAYNH